MNGRKETDSVPRFERLSDRIGAHPFTQSFNFGRDLMPQTDRIFQTEYSLWRRVPGMDIRTAYTAQLDPGQDCARYRIGYRVLSDHKVAIRFVQ